MSVILDAAKRADLQQQAQKVDELLRLAMAVTRRVDSAKEYEAPKETTPSLDLKSVKEYATNYDR